MNDRVVERDDTFRVSLRDVAEQTGVSFQTVSKVLRGSGRVAPDTRQRILETALALGYVPNTLARGLATRQTQTIGFIGSGLASFVLAPLMNGAEREARSHGYFTLMTLAEGDGDHANRLLHQLVERRVDGIINAALTMQHQTSYADLLRRLAPTVSLFPIHGGGVPVIGPDPTTVGLLATCHLISLGHRVIGTIAGEADYRTAKRGRLSGWERALTEIGEPPTESLVEFGRWTAEGGYAAMNRLLDRTPRLTAVFAHNDHMAIGAIKALHDRNLDVPGDIAIVGCDDIDLARFMTPALTTIRMPFDEYGAAAVRMLLEHLTTNRPFPAHQEMPADLVIRDSCGAPIAAKTFS